ncbi:YiaA/YiaB family inner membrane protein [Akkermansiaceae bacterium]|nr:YiaA/YiaB family inner membrane protein [Akkermansiaceae bacterium]
MNQTRLYADSGSWITFTKLSFLVSLTAMIGGITMLPLDIWTKGYFSMGLFFLISSTISVSKTLRDKHEYDRIINRVEEAKTEKILKEYGS